MCKLVEEARETTRRVEEIVSRMGDIASREPTRSYLDHNITVRQAIKGSLVAIGCLLVVMVISH